MSGHHPDCTCVVCWIHRVAPARRPYSPCPDCRPAGRPYRLLTLRLPPGWPLWLRGEPTPPHVLGVWVVRRGYVCPACFCLRPPPRLD